MILLTDRAKERLKALVMTRLQGRRRSLRLARAIDGEFGLVSDTPRPGDRRVEHDGTLVLLLSPPLASWFDGWTLDYPDDADGDRGGLRLRPGRTGEGVAAG
jgi:hypothetical protein